jgi:hypothetical protein
VLVVRTTTPSPHYPFSQGVCPLLKELAAALVMLQLFLFQRQVCHFHTQRQYFVRLPAKLVETKTGRPRRNRTFNISL